MRSTEVCGSFIRRTAFAGEETIKCPPGLQFHLPTCSCNFHSNNQCPRNCPGESQQSSSSNKQPQAKRKHTKNIWMSDVFFSYYNIISFLLYAYGFSNTILFTKFGMGIENLDESTSGSKINQVSAYILLIWFLTPRNTDK